MLCLSIKPEELLCRGGREVREEVVALMWWF